MPYRDGVDRYAGVSLIYVGAAEGCEKAGTTAISALTLFAAFGSSYRFVVAHRHEQTHNNLCSIAYFTRSASGMAWTGISDFCVLR